VHQDFEIPRRPLHEQVFFVLESVYSQICVHLWPVQGPEPSSQRGHASRRLGLLIEDILSGEQISSSIATLSVSHPRDWQITTKWSTIPEKVLVLGGPMPLAVKAGRDLLGSRLRLKIQCRSVCQPEQVHSVNLQVGLALQVWPPSFRTCRLMPSVNTSVWFEDGDYVFAHTEYNSSATQSARHLSLRRWSDCRALGQFAETATNPAQADNYDRRARRGVDLDQTGANKGAHAALHGRTFAQAVARLFPATSTYRIHQHNPWVAILSLV